MKTKQKSQSVSVKSGSLNRGCKRIYVSPGGQEVFFNTRSGRPPKIFNLFLVSVDQFGNKRSRLFYTGERYQLYLNLVQFFNHCYEDDVPLKVSLSHSFFSCYNCDPCYSRYKSNLSYFKDVLPFDLDSYKPVAFAMELNTRAMQKFYFIASECQHSYKEVSNEK